MHISCILRKPHGTNRPILLPKYLRSVPADSPPHHCLLPANATLNASIPRELHGGKWRWNQCHVYVNSSYSNDTETCPNGWHYDTDYTSTIVSEVSSSSRSSNNSCSIGSSNDSSSSSISSSSSSKRHPTVSDSALERSNRKTGPVIIDVEDSCRSSRRSNISSSRSSGNNVSRNISRGSGCCNSIKYKSRSRIINTLHCFIFSRESLTNCR